MANIDFSDALQILKSGHNYQERQKIPFSFGNISECKEMLIQAIKTGDKTITDLKFINEYVLVAEYLSDSKGKGLLLSGDVGRGKSLIVEKALPILFMKQQNRVIKIVHATEMEVKLPELKRLRLFTIDDVGVESLMNDYGIQKEPFVEIVDMADRNDSLIFITTNLDFEQMMHRYGERTMDRLKRLTIPIRFSGQSFRE